MDSLALPKKLKISPSVLLSFYAIIPVAVFLAALDHFYFNNHYRNHLPMSPEHLFWFTLFFVAPHIYANHFSLLDADYWKFYKSHILIILPAIAAFGYFAPKVWGPAAFGLFYSIWQMKHAINQQFALAPMLSAKPDRYYTYWKWLGIILGITMYAGLAPEDIHFEVKNIIVYISIFTILPFIFLTYKTSEQCKNFLGSAYIWANFLMVETGIILYLCDYSFCALLIPRIVHDLTAFYFYSVHDHNRNMTYQHNLLYRWFSFTRIPVAVLCPLLACLILLPFNFDPKPGWFWVFSPIISMSHFYLESVTWKYGTPHRQQISLA